MLRYLSIVFGWFFQPYECPFTGEACPHPDRCGFYFTMTSCHAQNVEFNQETGHGHQEKVQA